MLKKSPPTKKITTRAHQYGISVHKIEQRAEIQKSVHIGVTNYDWLIPCAGSAHITNIIILFLYYIQLLFFCLIIIHYY